MPTPPQAFAVVAHALGNVDPEDRTAVGGFYEHVFPSYPDAVKELVSDFVISQTSVPSTEDLVALREAVSELYDEAALTSGPIAGRVTARSGRRSRRRLLPIVVEAEEAATEAPRKEPDVASTQRLREQG